MSEESQGPSSAPDSGGERITGEAPRRLPARTGRRLALGDWVARTLDIVEMMADATREALLKKRV